MLKRVLGIKKLEKNFKVVGDSLNRSWEWINHFDKINSGYDERISRLERSNMQLIEVTQELINQLQELSEERVVKKEVVVKEAKPEQVMVPKVPESVDLPDKDLFLLRLIHQYAAFDKENSIDTNTIYDNLTFKITQRGLRKKLKSLVDDELLRTTKKGNTRYWYLNAGTLAKIKKALKSKE